MVETKSLSGGLYAGRKHTEEADLEEREARGGPLPAAVARSERRSPVD